jgi:hypothetical protein
MPDESAMTANDPEIGDVCMRRLNLELEAGFFYISPMGTFYAVS